MLVGIVSGTYSTIFIAAAIAIILSKAQAVDGGGAPPAADDRAERPRRAAARRALPDARLRVTCLARGAARGRAGTHRVPAGLQLGASILARAFFGWDAEQFGLAFDVACHVGTLAAMLIFFRRDSCAMLRACRGACARRRTAALGGSG